MKYWYVRDDGSIASLESIVQGMTDYGGRKLYTTEDEAKAAAGQIRRRR